MLRHASLTERRGVRGTGMMEIVGLIEEHVMEGPKHDRRVGKIDAYAGRSRSWRFWNSACFSQAGLNEETSGFMSVFAIERLEWMRI